MIWSAVSHRFLSVVLISTIICEEVKNRDTELLKSSGFVTKYIRIKRQLNSFLPDDLDSSNKNIETVERLPQTEKVSQQKDELLVFGDIPESVMVKVDNKDLHLAEQLPESDRVRGILPEDNLPLIGQFPSAERVTGRNDDKTTEITKLPKSDKVRDNPNYGDSLLEIDRLPEAERVKLGKRDENILNVEDLPPSEQVRFDHAGAMYADDALVAARVPSGIEETDLNPERVMDGKIIDNVDIEAVKRIDNWQPGYYENMEADRVQESVDEGKENGEEDMDQKAGDQEKEMDTENTKQNVEKEESLNAEQKQPAEQGTEQTAEQGAEQPAETGAEQPAEQGAEQPAETASEDTADGDEDAEKSEDMDQKSGDQEKEMDTENTKGDQEKEMDTENTKQNVEKEESLNAEQKQPAEQGTE